MKMLGVMDLRHHIRLSTVLVALLAYLVENWPSILEICVRIAEASPLSRINLDTDPITIQIKRTKYIGIYRNPKVGCHYKNTRIQ